MHTKSDQELLLSLAQSADEALASLAVDHFFKRHSNKVYNYGLKRGLNGEQAQDLVQIVFLQIFRKRHQYTLQQAVLAWLFAITKSELIDYKIRELKDYAEFDETLPKVDEREHDEIAKILKETESFIESGHAQLPSSSLDLLKRELFPPFALVATKMGCIHLLSSILTLMACPQFGLRLFFEGQGLMHYFMQAGNVACFAFSGAFYLGASFWIAKVFLGEFEWALLRRNSAMFLSALALISLGAFSLIMQNITFENGLVWVLGALVSGAIPLLTGVRHRPLLKTQSHF
jgi:RNA polymerase sigma factor (sigma-70 family)